LVALEIGDRRKKGALLSLRGDVKREKEEKVGAIRPA